jgi:NAD(P)H-dependent flavin oxidoreductase YrpB (nitropropane dioxygenase family)
MKIGDLSLEIPVVQGGMGVGVSLSGLAGAVASCGGLGVISTAQIGFRDADFARHPIDSNLKAVGEEIRKARKIAGNSGVIGVNIMVVTRRYEDYVKAAVEAGADIIISGAGLPMELPALVEGSNTKIAPIVSGKRALMVIMRYWQKHYGRKPDMVVIEGPLAGGHLGFNREQIDTLTEESYDEEIKSILEITDAEGIPTVVGGGVYTRHDMEHYMSMGAAGVQMATRFVTTYECDAHMNYKQAYIDAKKEDIVIVSSPVGMPGRAIHNEFLDRVAKGERFMNGCRQCITTCNPATSPYCITEALINAVEGRCSEGLLFCGSNAYRADKLEKVSDIMEEFRL